MSNSTSVLCSISEGPSIIASSSNTDVNSSTILIVGLGAGLLILISTVVTIIYRLKKKVRVAPTPNHWAIASENKHSSLPDGGLELETIE